MTGERLEEVLAIWQKRLRLQDWRVKLEVVRQKVARTEGYACVDWDRNYRRARVQLIHPGDLNASEFSIPVDLEIFMVHELLHLFFCNLENDGNDEPEWRLRELEFAVQSLAEALVELGRVTKPKEWNEVPLGETGDWREAA